MWKIDSHRTTDVRGYLNLSPSLPKRIGWQSLASRIRQKRRKEMLYEHLPARLPLFRSAHGVLCHIRTGHHRRLLLPVKNNIGPKARGIGYCIVTEIITNGIIAPRIMWSDEPVDMDADEAIAAANAAAKNSGARREKRDFGPKKLKRNGLVDATGGLEAEKENGIAEATLRRARTDLGVKAIHKPGLHDGWDWVLPCKIVKCSTRPRRSPKALKL